MKLDIQLGNSSLHYMYYFSTVLCTIMNSDIQLCNSSYLLTKKTLHSCMYVLGLKKFETGLSTVQWESTQNKLGKWEYEKRDHWCGGGGLSTKEIPWLFQILKITEFFVRILHKEESTFKLIRFVNFNQKIIFYCCTTPNAL